MIRTDDGSRKEAKGHGSRRASDADALQLSVPRASQDMQDVLGKLRRQATSNSSLETSSSKKDSNESSSFSVSSKTRLLSSYNDKDFSDC